MEGDNPASWIWTAYNYPAQDMARFERTLLRYCRDCHAEVGKLCRTPAGVEIRDMDFQHARRRINCPTTGAADGGWLEGENATPRGRGARQEGN